MFGFRKKAEPREWDREKLEPVIRKSICTGEEVAGFRDKDTGKFSSVMLIMKDGDLDSFRKEWGIEGEIPVIY